MPDAFESATVALATKTARRDTPVRPMTNFMNVHLGRAAIEVDQGDY